MKQGLERCSEGIGETKRRILSCFVGEEKLWSWRKMSRQGKKYEEPLVEVVGIGVVVAAAERVFVVAVVVVGTVVGVAGVVVGIVVGVAGQIGQVL